MSALKYGFINARIGAMKAQLLDPLEMKSLIESRNLDDALALLKNTAYGKELSKLSTPSVAEVENVLSRSLYEDMDKLRSSVSGISKDFLSLYAKKFELDAVKLILVMKIKGEDIKEQSWIMQRIMAVPMAEKLVDMGSPAEIVEMLRDTKYYSALQEALSAYNETGNANIFITALDNYLYGQLNRIIKKMDGKDKGMARHIIGIEVDAINLMIALRMRGNEKEEISNWLAPMRYRLTDSELMAAFNSKNVSEIQQIFRHYSDIISKGTDRYEETGSLFSLESEFKRFHVKENAKVFAGDRFHIGVPLGYLNLKSNEVQNITAVLHGKEEGLSADMIERTVVLPA